jgi:flagellar motility protein MotE (MotC chaperone)
MMQAMKGMEGQLSVMRNLVRGGGGWLRPAIAGIVAVKVLALLSLLNALAVGDAPVSTPAQALAAETAGNVGDERAPEGAVKSKAVSPGTTDDTTAGSSEEGFELEGPSADFAAQREAVRELLEAIQQRSSELAQREADLSRREAAIDAAGDDLEKKIARLEDLAAEPRQPAQRGPAGGPQATTTAPVTSMAQLGKIYGAMKAEEAAPLLDRLDNGTVRELFAHMKQRQISAVLPLMDPEKAVALTELLSGRAPRPTPLPEKIAGQDGE